MGLEDLHPILLAFLSSLFTWGTTALGAAVVLCFGRQGFKPATLDFLFGASAGVMLSASFFSLLMPSLSLSRQLSYPAFIPVLGGFLLGVGVLELADWLIPENESGGSRLCCFTSKSESPENFPLDETTFDDELNLSLDSEVSTTMDDSNVDVEVTKQFNEDSELVDRIPKNMLLLVIAVTIHNLPEGFVVGVSFGSVYEQSDVKDALIQAMLLALAIGLQNIPEGAAVALPLKKAGLSRFKSFMYGQFSGFVEVIGALLGATMVYFVGAILPYALSFAAGAMIYVVVKELIPRSQSSGKTVGNIGIIAGFCVMMTMEVAF